MASIPVGIEVLDDQHDADNLILSVSGGPKTGKTFLATHVNRPVYYLMLDPHDNLRRAFDHANDSGYTGPVYIKRIRPLPYSQLTEAKAEGFLKEIEDFAAWARQSAREARAKGEPTGTFVLDGGKRFKGYVERAKLGESITLGWRPSKGGTSISRYDYAEANTYIVDFLAGFLSSPLDVIITFEGARKYVGSDRTEEFRSGAPDGIGYVTHAEVVTQMDKEPIVVNQKVVGYTSVPKMRIVYNDAAPFLNDRVMKSQSFNELKALFGIEDPVVAEGQLDPTEQPIAEDPFAAKPAVS